MPSIAAGLYSEEAKQVVVFSQFSGFRLKGTMSYTAEKAVMGVRALFCKTMNCFLFCDFSLSLGAGGSLQLLELKDYFQALGLSEICLNQSGIYGKW